MKIRRLNYALFLAIPLWIGMAMPLAKADSIVDPANFSIVAEDGDYGGFVSCSTSNPCTSSGPSSGTVSLVLPPSGYPADPDNNLPYSGSASATVSGSPSPALGVAASAAAVQLIPAGSVYDLFTMNAGASLTYYFELTGPASSTGIPVLMDGSSSLFSQVDSSDDTTSSSVSMSVAAADGSSTLYTLPAGNDSGFNQVLGILPDVLYEVTMGASVSVQVGATEDSDPSLIASATIDPIFTVSPDYASDYSLTFSDGIGDVASSTPEPATWAMMLIGVAGLGAAVRFRRGIKTDSPR